MESFPARPSALHEVRAFVSRQAREADFPPEVCQDLTLATSEAAANAVKHAGRGTIKVRWRDLGKAAEILVEDEGMFRLRDPGTQDAIPRGHGLRLMMALADEVTIRPGTAREAGTVVRLIKYRPGKPRRQDRLAS
jgi:anti-sigma regulatory factor (Ser/Thr protein kinase)